MLWFNFILGSNFVFLCFKLIIIHYNTHKQKKRKFEPRIKLDHNRYEIGYGQLGAMHFSGYLPSDIQCALVAQSFSIFYIYRQIIPFILIHILMKKKKKRFGEQHLSSLQKCIEWYGKNMVINFKKFTRDHMERVNSKLALQQTSFSSLMLESSTGCSCLGSS